MERKKTMTIVTLAFSNMFAQCCNSLIGPFFPLEAAKKDTSESMIGVIFSCSEFVIFLTSPIFGSMMSSVSPRFMYIAGLCVYGCCDVMFGFLNQSPPGTPFISICLAVRIVEATGTSALMTASFAIAGHVFPERISTVYSILQAASGIGYIIGPAFGGLLYQLGGYGYPFWILGSCVFLCGCVSMLVLPDQHIAPEKHHQSTLSLLSLFRSPLVCYGALCIMCNMVAVTVYFPTFAQELTKYDIGTAVAGLIFIVPALAYALTSPMWGALLDKKVEALPLIVGALAFIVVDLLFFGPAPFMSFLADILWLQVLCCGLLGFFVAASAVGAIRSVIIGARNMGLVSDGSTYGLVAGITQSATCFGSFAGPLLGGILTDNYGFSWSLTIVSFICIVPFILGCIGLCNRSEVKKSSLKTPLLQDSGTQYNSSTNV